MRLKDLQSLAAATLVAMCAHTGLAQDLLMRGLRLTPIEQGVDDADPLATNLRMVRQDYRLSTNFERLYEARIDRGPFGAHLAGDREQTVLVRFAGGLAAVFPRSEYVRYGAYTFAAIPTGTKYSIGGAIEKLLNPGGFAVVDQVRPAGFIDRSARMPRTLAAQYAAGPRPREASVLTWTSGRPGEAVQGRANENTRAAKDERDSGRSVERATIWTNEAYRVHRLSLLMDVAVSTAQARASEGSAE